MDGNLVPDKGYRKSLDLLFKTFLDVTKGNKERKYFSIYTDMVGYRPFYENINNNKKMLKETIAATFQETIAHFKKIAQEKNYPNSIEIVINIKSNPAPWEKDLTEIPHSRYLRTNSFNFSLDRGFHFFSNKSNEYVLENKIINESSSNVPGIYHDECKNAKDLVKKIEGKYSPI